MASARLRRRRLGLAWMLPLVLALLGGCVGDDAAGGPRLRDDQGRLVDVGDLSRIVVTSVDLAEVFVLLGHADRLVGVPAWIASSSGCVSILPGADDLPRLGRPVVIEAEEVLARDPTLVIDKPFPLSPTSLADRLDAVGVPAFRIAGAESIDNVRHTFETVGRILSTVDATAPQNASRLWDAFAAELDATTNTLRDHGVGTTVARPRALYQLPAGLVAAGGTSGSVLLGQAGAQDIADAAGLSGYRQLSAEIVAAADPERVFVSCTAGTAAILGAPKFAGSTAARIGPEAVFIADPATSALVGPRFAAGVRTAAEWLHPVAFGRISPNISVETHEEDSLVIDAASSQAVDGPLRFRFLPGDGSGAVDSMNGTFRHRYAGPPGQQPMLLLIDGAGRMHSERITSA